MRLSAEWECSRALMQASMMAWVSSSTRSGLIPISRAKLPAARAAAISISSTMGRVSSICRSAVAVIEPVSSRAASLKGEKECNRGLDPGRNATELLQSEERAGVDSQNHRKRAGERDGVGAGAGLCNVAHE